MIDDPQKTLWERGIQLVVITMGSLISYFMWDQKKLKDRVTVNTDSISDHKADIAVIKNRLMNIDGKLDDIIKKLDNKHQ